MALKSLISRIKRRLVKAKPSYTITLSGTPAGKTWTTSGKLVSTPGTPARPGFSFSDSGRITQQTALRKAAEAARKAREEAARKELERVRKESLAREAARREVARKEFGRAIARAKERKSISAQVRAKEMFLQTQKTIKEEKRKTMQKPSEVVKKVMAASLITHQKEIKEKEEIAKEVAKLVIKRIKLKVPELEKKFAKTSIGKIFNVASGGTLERRELDREQTHLNKRIDEFNGKFGGRELSESEFKSAIKIQQNLIKKEEGLTKEREELVKSFRKGVKGFFFGSPLKSTQEEREKAIKKYGEEIKSHKSKLKKPGLSEFKTHLLKGQMGVYEREISRLKGGGDVTQLRTGTVPITPIGAIPANVKVVFVGTQKAKGNKIVTDIIFKVGKKRVGMARGVTIAKGSRGETVVLGKTGISGVKFPSGKRALVKKQVFAGVERSKAVLAKLKIESPVKLPGGRISVVRRNIQGFKQVGVGKVATVRGEKLFHTGVRFPSGKIITKKATGINVNDFASFAATLTKGDLSLIVGKAITSSKDKIRFIGLIKGLGKPGKVFRLSGTQKLQYKKALQNVISVAASSLAKADKLKGLTTTQRIAASTHFARQAIKVKPALKPVVKVKPVVKPPMIKLRLKLKPKVVSAAKVKQGIAQLSGQQQKIRQRVEQVTKERQKVKTKTAQKSLQQQRQKLKMRLKTLTVQKAVLTGIHIKPTIILTPKQMRILGLVVPRKKKVIKLKLKPEIFQGYNVYGKHKGKFIKLSKKPLSKTQALDRGSFAIDKSTANTFKIEGVRKVKKLGKLIKGEKGHFSKTQKKYRSYRIQKGKRIALKDKYIERRGKPRIDTRGERRGLTLARFAKQRGFIGTPARRKSVGRKTIRRTPARASTRRIISTPQTIKRKPSPAQLKALANGRKALAKKRKGGNK